VDYEAFPSSRTIIALVFLCLLFNFACKKVSSGTAQDFHLIEVSNFGSNPGNLRMFEYVPASTPPIPAVVVAIHGCAQNAQDYANHSGWPEIADRAGFLLIFPQQALTNNPTRCFNWFERKNNRRDSGETLSIKQMLDKLKSERQVDSKRIFATGLSAGGAMTSVMLATYPEVFAGGAIMSGTPYGCATNLAQSLTCVRSKVSKTPKEWGELVRAASTATLTSWPVVSIWQGTEDKIVDPVNAREETEQWTNVHEVPQAASKSDAVNGYPHRVYLKNGKAVVEVYSITNMGHGQAIYPVTSGERCGAVGMFVPDAHICAAYYVSRFWGLVK
jgi:poly(hydroxyalkanoate) depolymerase family esterase